jgi:hypothetical protein
METACKGSGQIGVHVMLGMRGDMPSPKHRQHILYLSAKLSRPYVVWNHSTRYVPARRATIAVEERIVAGDVVGFCRKFSPGGI